MPTAGQNALSKAKAQKRHAHTRRSYYGRKQRVLMWTPLVQLANTDKQHLPLDTQARRENDNHINSKQSSL